MPLPEAYKARKDMVESYRQFVSMMREGAPHPLSGDSALKDQELVMAVYESARTHARIDLPLQQDAYPLALMIGEK